MPQLPQHLTDVTRLSVRDLVALVHDRPTPGVLIRHCGAYRVQVAGPEDSCVQLVPLLPGKRSGA